MKEFKVVAPMNISLGDPVDIIISPSGKREVVLSNRKNPDGYVYEINIETDEDGIIHYNVIVDTPYLNIF